MDFLERTFKFTPLALIVSTAAFISSGIITYKLLNRRHTYGSFRELYEDNSESLKKDKSNYHEGWCG